MAEPLPSVQFRSSLGQLLKLVGLAVLMTGGSGVLLWLGWRESDVFKLAIGAMGSLFFGFCLIIALWRMLTASGGPVTLTATGLRDPRVAREEIPWLALEKISTWTLQGQTVMVLRVRPEVEARLGLTPMARWTRGPNKALGADGLCISPLGLDVSYDRMLEATIKYASAAPGAVTGSAADDDG